MFKKWILVLALTSAVFVDGESSSGNTRDSSSFLLLSKYLSNDRVQRGQWSYRPQEDSHRHAFEGISHLSTFKNLENSYEGPYESGLSQDYWSQYPGWKNFSSTNFNDYSKPSGFFHKDSVEVIHSRYPYQQIRPGTASYITAKKIPSDYLKEKFQVQASDASEKTKFKNSALRQSLINYKKLVFSKVAKPFPKEKYASQNHPFYRRYYQSPYQRYGILSKPPNELLRYKDNSPGNVYYKGSTLPPNQNSGRYHTTERMDDAHSDGSTPWEDYSAFNISNHNTSGNYYEEVEKEISEFEESPHEGGTTRGYYGDRIYMSTPAPLISSDKTGVKNKYFIIRKTSHDDDIETLFE